MEDEIESTEREKIDRLIEVGLAVPSVIHDIRGYISAIKAHAQLGIKETDDTKAISRFEKIISLVNSIEDMVETFRSFYKAGEIVKKEVEISCVIDEALSSISHRLGSVNLIKEVENYKIYANKVLLKQAFVNLLSNALDAVENSEEKLIGIKTHAGKGKNFIWVFDSGIGISPEDEKKLFLPLFTTKTSGIGIGSYIAKKIIEAHGGEIKYLRNVPDEVLKISKKYKEKFANIKTVFEICLP